MTDKPLTPKQEAFVREYLLDLNATGAARRAGYSDRTAKHTGHELLGKEHVQAAIQKAMRERATRTEISADKVVQRIAQVAFGDLRGCFDEAGRLRRPEEWPDDVAALLGGVEVVTVSAGEGEVEHVAKIKSRDTLKALEMLGRHLGIFEKDNERKVELIIPGGLEET